MSFWTWEIHGGNGNPWFDFEGKMAAGNGNPGNPWSISLEMIGNMMGFNGYFTGNHGLLLILCLPR